MMHQSIQSSSGGQFIPPSQPFALPQFWQDKKGFPTVDEQSRQLRHHLYMIENHFQDIQRDIKNEIRIQLHYIETGSISVVTRAKRNIEEYHQLMIYCNETLGKWKRLSSIAIEGWNEVDLLLSQFQVESNVIYKKYSQLQQDVNYERKVEAALEGEIRQLEAKCKALGINIK